MNRFNRMTAHLAKTRTLACVSSGPILSICFDDFPKSAWTRGGSILERYGAKATYYAAGRFCGRTIGGAVYFDRSDLAQVALTGHEVGCHSYSHEHGTRIPSPELAVDYARNREFLSERLPRMEFSSFAYPYGDVSARVKALAAQHYTTARGIRPGVNINPIDLALLNAMPLESRSWTAPAMEDLAREAARTNGWLILFTHDVDETPSPYGVTPAMLSQALDIALGHRLEILPVGAAAARLTHTSALDLAAIDRAA
jgi:peptidoglycan/xylan/chitin deacetylase (PgdA/CDA1 family)